MRSTMTFEPRYQHRMKRYVPLLFLLILVRCEAFQSSTRVAQAPSLAGLFPLHRRSIYSRSVKPKEFFLAQQSSSSRRMQEWDGDDLRWYSKLRRRLRRRGRDGTPVKTTLIGLNLVFFIYQTITTVNFIRRGHPSYWPRYAFPMIWDAIVGSSINGPLTLDFSFSNSLSQNQPHRFLTSGFLHGGILHFLINMDSLLRQPSWLEAGLGGPLYLTTFLVSIVTGNLGHMWNVGDPFDRTLCLGSSGGICGLYGLMYASLVRMGNQRAATRVAKGMAILLVMGLFVDNVSTMAHVGGFLGGVVVSILCGPKYRQSYAMRRKNTAEYDPAPRDYRQAMGFGVMPSERGIVPLPLLWGVLGIILVTAKPRFRAIPAKILQGVLFPGSLTP